MREIYIWSKAKHENVHELLGIIMFQGRLGMVSPWMENGNLQEYIQKQPDVDRYKLVRPDPSQHARVLCHHLVLVP